MSDVPSKLELLGDLLGVHDDTREIERPPRPAVGAVLAGDHPPAPPTTEGDDATAAPVSAERPVVDRVAPVRSESLPPERASGDRASARRRPIPGRSVTDRPMRTSANLPVVLVERLTEARRHRWGLSTLVPAALAHLDLDEDQADRALTENWDAVRVQQAYQLPADVIADLDALGEKWRMNRSQVLAVILPAELHRLGL